MAPPPYHFLLPLLLFSLLLSRATPAQFPIAGLDPNDLLGSEARVLDLFQQWRATHGKEYPNPEETSTRFETFKRNLEYVVEMMNGPNRTGHAVGLNRFADLSNEEFREKYMGLKVRSPVRLGRRKRVDSVAKCDGPTSFDWREKGVVTPVKDQGQCGACWAFSSTGAIESINAINTGELVSLSEQELVDCDTTQQGCDGGIMDKAFKWIIRNGGIETEDEYPYRAVRGACNALNGANKVSIDGYEDVSESESALMCALLKQPISVGIDGSSMDFQLYSGGIYEGECSSNPDDLSHAVLIVGYGSENGKDYWIVKNSWGTTWGMNGYIHIRRNTKLPYGVCAINSLASYPTQPSNSSSPPFPSPVSPPPPTPPPPSECGNLAYCSGDQTCCCIFKFFGLCFVQGCCPYKDAVCCADSDNCCPSDYPVCDVPNGLCNKKAGDYLGVAAKTKKLAKYKFLRYKDEQIQNDIIDEPLQWRDQFAAFR